jgi:hypothetical protein
MRSSITKEHVSAKRTTTTYERGGWQVPPYVSKLVGDTGERRAETGRAHLGQLDRNDAPRSLHTKLQPERAGREPAERVGEDPERDESASPHNKEDDGETTTDEL